ncbi:DUF6221 family protein [Streptomyces anulatus]|uniref:DUF6221 family protein n=1 Tax=Streptomyces anulatus TaxID=1892 RepID=UPI00341FB8B4
MSRELLDFLRARLDEESTEAQAASSKPGGGRWKAVLDPEDLTAVCGQHKPGEPGYPDLPVVASPDDHETSVHIARQDPARVLREVEAKRELLADYERFVAERRRLMGGWDSYPEVSPVLTAFAAVYSDHPDYWDEWRPTP